MSKRLPLTLDDTGAEQQLQRNDRIDPERTKLVSREEFDEIVNNFRLLLLCLREHRIELPDELETEVNLLKEK